MEAFGMYTFDSDYLESKVLSMGNCVLVKPLVSMSFSSVFFTIDPKKVVNADVLVVSDSKKESLTMKLPVRRDNMTVIYTDKPISSLGNLLQKYADKPSLIIYFWDFKTVVPAEEANRSIETGARLVDFILRNHTLAQRRPRLQRYLRRIKLLSEKRASKGKKRQHQEEQGNLGWFVPKRLKGSKSLLAGTRANKIFRRFCTYGFRFFKGSLMLRMFRLRMRALRVFKTVVSSYATRIEMMFSNCSSEWKFNILRHHTYLP